THPLSVRYLVENAIKDWNIARVPGDLDDALIAALLHDVVEDSDIPIEEIYTLFGGNVGRMVRLLTKPPREAGNRKQRKLIYTKQLYGGDAYTKAIKLCDILHNSLSLGDLEEGFARLLAEEYELMSFRLLPKCVHPIGTAETMTFCRIVGEIRKALDPFLLPEKDNGK
ncbi:MAG: hypothetical protein ACWGQW_18715, partial [bacterium]